MTTSPPALDEPVRSVLRRLQWRMRGQRVQTMLAGHHGSIFRGPGMEFDQVVRFELGDDIRDIDWNVTARRGELYRKVFMGDREAGLMIIFADAPALQFGGGTRSKRAVLLECAALVMLLGAVQGEPVSLIHQSPSGSRVFPAVRARPQILKMIGALFAAARPDPLGADACCAPCAQPGLPKGTQVVWLGEVPHERPSRPWVTWQHRHRVIGLRAEDPWERLGPLTGALAAYDSVSRKVVDLRDDAATRARHAAWRKRQEERWRAWWPHPAYRLTLDTAEDVLEALSAFLALRHKRA